MDQSSKNKTTQLDKDLLITRGQLGSLLHCGISSIDSSETYASIPRIKIGRHTFFLKEDVMNFIMSHRTGGTK